MLQTIEITISNGICEIIHALLISEKKICYINNKKYEVTDDFCDRLKSIIALWKNDYGSDNKIDSEEFNIIVTTSDGEEKFHGKGKYPNNYRLLKELIGDVND